MFHFAGGVLGQFIVRGQDLDEEFTKGFVPSDDISRCLLAGGGDHVVWCFVDELPRLERAGDRRVADLEELGNILGPGRVFLPYDVKDRLEIVFETGVSTTSQFTASGR